MARKKIDIPIDPRAPSSPNVPAPDGDGAASLTIRLPRALRSRLAEVTALLNQSPPPGSGFIRASESLVARLALARGLDALASEARGRGDSAEGE